jgi:hypothetical protein
MYARVLYVTDGNLVRGLWYLCKALTGHPLIFRPARDFACLLLTRTFLIRAAFAFGRIPHALFTAPSFTFIDCAFWYTAPWFTDCAFSSSPDFSSTWSRPQNASFTNPRSSSPISPTVINTNSIVFVWQRSRGVRMRTGGRRRARRHIRVRYLQVRLLELDLRVIQWVLWFQGTHVLFGCQLLTHRCGLLIRHHPG